MSLLQKIKVISLDAMNTVIKLRESPGETYAKFVSTKYQINIDPTVLNKSFHEIFHIMENKEPCYSFKNNGAKYWWQETIRLSFQKVKIILVFNNKNNLVFKYN